MAKAPKGSLTPNESSAPLVKRAKENTRTTVDPCDMSASPVMCDQRSHENRERSRQKKPGQKVSSNTFATENYVSMGNLLKLDERKDRLISQHKSKKNSTGSQPKEAKTGRKTSPVRQAVTSKARTPLSQMQKLLTTALVSLCTHSNMHTETRPPEGKATHQVYLLCRAEHLREKQAQRRPKPTRAPCSLYTLAPSLHTLTPRSCCTKTAPPHQDKAPEGAAQRAL